jgi:protein FAM32A
MENVVKQVTQEDKPGSASASGRSTPAIASSSDGGSRKTDAERRFEEIQQKRVGLFFFMTSIFD